MRSLTMASLGAGLLLVGSAIGAQALPIAPAPEASPLIEKVIGGDGCGPYAIRGPRGFCRPLGGPRRFYGGPGYGPRYYGGPRVYGPRVYGPPPPRFYGPRPFYY